MNDKDRLNTLKKHSAPCTDMLGTQVLSFSSEPPSIEMEFEAKYEFTHSEGQIVQGGFVTGMLDTPMAHLLMGLFDFKVSPMTLDINVSFLAPSKPGKLNCIAEVIQLRKSTAFMASKLYQDNSMVATATSAVKLIPFAKS